MTNEAERRQACESFKRDALAAWDEYQRTRLHLTLAEVDAWLASWGTADEQPMPELHR
ncbi:transcriptional regulator [Salmonella enterica subsp. enterica serovar Muenster]|nr:transcriptional regulator [Salmonella enterica subsp. enterica serovar Muenster]